MVHLRATQKVLARLHADPREAPPSTNVLGDWFVNRFVWGNQPILLLMSSASRLIILDPAREVSRLPERLPSLVGHRLTLLGINPLRIQQEITAMGDVVVARTNDRSVLSAMNQFTDAARYFLEGGRWAGGDFLEETQSHLGGILTTDKGRGYIKPREEARALLGG
jgi:hypothetical protein